MAVGPVVTAQHIAQALRAGTAEAVPEPEAAALVSRLFVELEPRLVALCAAEAGADLRQANRLYDESVANSVPRNAAWEAAMEVYR